MMGGTLVAFLGGLHYWWPKMFGRMYSELWGRISCLIIFAGFNLTFFPQFLLGTHGMPRRYARYLPEFQPLHQMSTIGSMILGVGLFLAAGVLLHSLFRGRPAPKNPWGGGSLEWETTSPPSPHNFEETPSAADCYDFQRLVYSEEEGGYVKRQPAPAK
jgi:cytochrome c oxidase subunit 1